MYTVFVLFRNSDESITLLVDSMEGVLKFLKWLERNILNCEYLILKDNELVRVSKEDIDKCEIAMDVPNAVILSKFQH